MIRTLTAFALALLMLAPVRAQDAGGAFDQDADRYVSGATVTVGASDLDEVFAAGERIEVTAATEGSVHLAARRIETTQAIGGALYAIGADVTIDGPVAGSASIVGYDVTLRGAIGGGLRVLGTHIVLRAPVGGAALITGRDVEIAGPIAGDASIAARSLTFGPEARVDGRLTLYAPEGAAIEVPASVVPADRIDRRTIEERAPMLERVAGPGWRALALGFAIGAVILAAFATLAGALAPRGMARLGAIMGEGPLRAFGFGFLTQAALIGASILLAISLVGIVLAPFVVIGMLLLGFLGYVVAVYLTGEWVITRLGALAPDSFAEHALAGLAGALVVGLIGLVPILGWFAVLALALAGVGTLTIARLRRRYSV